MFSVKKAIALSQQIITNWGDKGAMPYLKLMKLIYFCDREMLQNYDRFITGDSMYSMRMGPVPSKIYHLIKSYRETKDQDAMFLDANESTWNTYIETRKGYVVAIKNKMAESILTEDEVNIINTVTGAIGMLTWQELVDFTHDVLPEWTNPPGNTSIPIAEELIKVC